MSPIPQPFFVEWSPSTVGTQTPSWEVLGRVYALTARHAVGELSRPVSEPGKAMIAVRNSANPADSPWWGLGNWYRYAPVRVRYTSDAFGTATVWTGFVLSIKHDLSDTPMAVRFVIEAVDALGLRAMTTTSRELADVTEGTLAALGFDETITAFATEMDDGLFAGIDLNSLAEPPIKLPAKLQKNTDTYTTDASFAEKQLTTLGKMLDVELGRAGVDPNGDLAIMGRYMVPDALIALPNPALSLVGTGGEIAAGIGDPTGMPWRRGSLVMSEPEAEYKNSASVKGFASKTTHASAAALPTGEPADAIEMLDVWTTDENWLQANADLLVTLYGNQKVSTPRSVDVVVWDAATQDTARLDAVSEAVYTPGAGYCSLSVPLPGGDSLAHLLTILGGEWKVNSSQAIVTIFLSNDAARWDQFLVNNSSSYRFFRLDVAGFGLDAGATLAP